MKQVIIKLLSVGMLIGLVLISYGAEREEKNEDAHHLLWSTYVQRKHDRHVLGRSLKAMSSRADKAERAAFVAACKAEKEQQDKIIAIIRRGTMQEVRQLLDARMNPSLRTCSLDESVVTKLNKVPFIKTSLADENRTLLQDAVLGLNIDVARLLVQAQADVHAENVGGATTLHYVAGILSDCLTRKERDDMESFCKFLLLEQGADLYKKDKDGQSPIDILKWRAPTLVPPIKMMAKQYQQFTHKRPIARADILIDRSFSSDLQRRYQIGQSIPSKFRDLIDLFALIRSKKWQIAPCQNLLKNVKAEHNW